MIFFDLDDTMLDYRTSQDLAASKFGEMFADRLVVETESFVELWHQISLKEMNRYLLGELSFQEQRQQRIRAAISCVKDNNEADSLFLVYHNIYQESWRLFPECIEALQLLASKRLGVITNGDANQQKYKLKRLGLDEFFEVVITPADAGEAKPNRKIFEFASTFAQCPPQCCWYVGDDYTIDYLAAKKLDWNAVWLNRGQETESSSDQCSNLLDFVDLVLQS